MVDGGRTRSLGRAHGVGSQPGGHPHTARVGSHEWVGQISQVVVDRTHIPVGDEVLFDGISLQPGVQFVLLRQGEMVGEPGKDGLTRPKTGGKPTWSGADGELRVGSKGPSSWLRMLIQLASPRAPPPPLCLSLCLSLSLSTPAHRQANDPHRALLLDPQL